MFKIIILFIVTLFIACSSTNTSINSYYADKYFANQTLTILPIHEDCLNCSNITGVCESFNVETFNCKSFLRDTLNGTIKVYAPRYSKGIRINSVPNNEDWFKHYNNASNFIIVKKNLDNDKTISFKIPKKKFLDSLGIKSDFVLSFSKVIVGDYSPNYVTNTTETFGMRTEHTYSITGEFKGITEFIIWDYALNKEMKYGVQSSSIELNVLSNSDNNSEKWKSIFRMITKNLFNDTPFDAGF